VVCVKPVKMKHSLIGMNNPLTFLPGKLLATVGGTCLLGRHLDMSIGLATPLLGAGMASPSVLLITLGDRHE
jgi:hypothetical protein